GHSGDSERAPKPSATSCSPHATTTAAKPCTRCCFSSPATTIHAAGRWSRPHRLPFRRDSDHPETHLGAVPGAWHRIRSGHVSRLTTLRLLCCGFCASARSCAWHRATPSCDVPLPLL